MSLRLDELGWGKFEIEMVTYATSAKMAHNINEYHSSDRT